MRLPNRPPHQFSASIAHIARRSRTCRPHHRHEGIHTRLQAHYVAYEGHTARNIGSSKGDGHRNSPPVPVGNRFPDRPDPC
eukprot:12937038-Prorocentrum_lima.AAC.1